MYPIITEKGLKDGKMECDLFGVTLKPSKDVDEVLKAIGLPNLSKANSKPILTNILKENKNPNIFFTRSVKDCLSFEEFLNSSEQNLLNFYSIVFNSLLCTRKSYHSDVYDEILDIATSFFIIGENKPTFSIFISTSLALYLKVFKEIGFSLQKETKKKTILINPQTKCLWQADHESIVKANTIALMLLTNQTTYYDEGVETPIIIDGVERMSTTWVDVTPPKLRLGKVPNAYQNKRGIVLRPGK